MMRLLLILPFIYMSAAFAGNDMGNGTDHFGDLAGVAWFTGPEKQIQVCLEVHRDFGASETQIKTEFESAFASWIAYIEKKRIEAGPFEERQAQFTRRYVWQSACNASSDLRIYAGESNAWVEKAKLKYENPLAFAERRSFDETAGWGKGFIWIASNRAINDDFPRWSDPDSLHAVILHELGHVFGVSHSQGTIMDSHLAKNISERKITGSALRQIDGWRQLYFYARDLQYDGVLGVAAGGDEDVRVFKWLFGRRSQGKIWAKFRGDFSTKGAELEAGDDKGREVFPIKCQWGTGSPVFQTDGPVFKRVIEGLAGWSQNSGGVLYCQLIQLDKTASPLLLEYNASSEETLGPISLKRLENGFPRTVFRAKVEGIKK